MVWVIDSGKTSDPHVMYGVNHTLRKVNLVFSLDSHFNKGNSGAPRNQMP